MSYLRRSILIKNMKTCTNLFKLKNGKTKTCHSKEFINGKCIVWLCGRCMEEKQEELKT